MPASSPNSMRTHKWGGTHIHRAAFFLVLVCVLCFPHCTCLFSTQSEYIIMALFWHLTKAFEYYYVLWNYPESGCSGIIAVSLWIHSISVKNRECLFDKHWTALLVHFVHNVCHEINALQRAVSCLTYSRSNAPEHVAVWLQHSIGSVQDVKGSWWDRILLNRRLYQK